MVSTKAHVQSWKDLSRFWHNWLWNSGRSLYTWEGTQSNRDNSCYREDVKKFSESTQFTDILETVSATIESVD